MINNVVPVHDDRSLLTHLSMNESGGWVIRRAVPVHDHFLSMIIISLHDYFLGIRTGYACLSMIIMSMIIKCNFRLGALKRQRPEGRNHRAFGNQVRLCVPVHDDS